MKNVISIEELGTPEKKWQYLKRDEHRELLLHWVEETIRCDFDFFVVLITHSDGIYFSGYPLPDEDQELVEARYENMNPHDGWHTCVIINIKTIRETDPELFRGK